MRPAEISAFLSSLAVRDKVAASTQNQALSALLFLYREVLGVDLPWLNDVVRAKRPQYLPVVLTREETRAVLQQLTGVPRIMRLAQAVPRTTARRRAQGQRLGKEPVQLLPQPVAEAPELLTQVVLHP
jgi:Phage integrase, N-terminal SAM-like domain